MLLASACGCAGVAPAPQEPTPEQVVREYVEYMKLAADSDARARVSMMQAVDRRMEESPVQARLQLGLLLTSPGETAVNSTEGEKILKSVLASEPALDPSVRDLVELRLMEVGARHDLQALLDDVEGKIEELMSIESSMDEKKIESQTRQR